MGERRMGEIALLNGLSLCLGRPTYDDQTIQKRDLTNRVGEACQEMALSPLDRPTCPPQRRMVHIMV